MSLSIISYEDIHQPVFKTLNLAWLEHYSLAESHDLDILNDPRGTILDGGGYIWLAKWDDAIVGSVALIREKEGEYELVKMGVKAEFHGRGIGKILMEHCLDKARELSANKIFLFSNHQLTTALKMYESFGFMHVPVIDSPFTTADVRMELVL
jgi:ribosomal protein S18 acetylase RimI-like enzyme